MADISAALLLDNLVKSTTDNKVKENYKELYRKTYREAYVRGKRDQQGQCECGGDDEE